MSGRLAVFLPPQTTTQSSCQAGLATPALTAKDECGEGHPLHTPTLLPLSATTWPEMEVLLRCWHQPSLLGGPTPACTTTEPWSPYSSLCLPPRPLCRRESAERPLRDTSGRECRRRCAWNDRGFGWWAWWGGGVVGCCVKYAVVWAGCTTLTLTFLTRTPRRSALERPPSDIEAGYIGKGATGSTGGSGGARHGTVARHGCCLDLCCACGPTSPHHAALFNRFAWPL